MGFLSGQQLLQNLLMLPVLILSLDPLCRNEVGPYLGLQPPSLAELLRMVGKDPSMVRLLKGIPATWQIYSSRPEPRGP